ncbi:hypothetical protein BGW42_003623 [Actinomortierella wolfii]|nr:hypothetical protein BGW42_003623 [Actinomortierella wolfii]
MLRLLTLGARRRVQAARPCTFIAFQKPRRRWTKEEDNKLRELGASAGKTLTWEEVAEQMQLPLSSVYHRYSKLMDPRLGQLVENEDKMRELEHLVEFQLHWQEIAKILGDWPAILVETAFKRRHPAMSPVHLNQLILATTNQRYDLRQQQERSTLSSLLSDFVPKTNHLDGPLDYLGGPVKRWPEFDWELIASEIFNNKYDAATLRRDYFRHRVTALRFANKHHAALRTAVLNQIKGSRNSKGDESKIDWEAVHRELDSQYSPAVCRHAWTRQHAQSYTMFPWTEDEMITYWQQFIRHGQQWDEIAKCLPNRTITECRRDFQKLAKQAEELGEEFQQRVIDGLSDDANKSHSNHDDDKSQFKFPTFFFTATSWTPELEARLLALHQEVTEESKTHHVSNFWETISTRLDAGASPLHCMHRFRKLEKMSKAQQQLETAAATAEQENNVDTDGETKKKKTPQKPHVILTAEESARLTRLVQEINPSRKAGWDAVGAQMPGRPVSSLKILWNELQRGMILNSPEGREALERAVLKHDAGMWHAIGDDLTQWLYRDRHPDDMPKDREGAARVRPKMAKMLWMRLHQGQSPSPIWTPDQVRRLKRVMRQVAGDRAKKGCSPTIEDWMAVGRHMESKDSLQCRTMWQQLQESPRAVEEEIEAQAVLQHLWLYGKLPTEEHDKAQWEKENPGVALRVPEFFREALSRKPEKSNGWSPSWDKFLDMTVDRYGATFANYQRLAEILGTTQLAVQRARHRMARRRYRRSRLNVEEDEDE